MAGKKKVETEKKRFKVMVGRVSFGGKDHGQGQVIETARDLESEPKYVNRVRLMDGNAVLPAPSKRAEATVKTKPKKRHAHKDEVEEVNDPEPTKED